MFSCMKSISHQFPLWPQWIAALEVFLILGTVGLTGGWTSPYLAKLSKPDSPLRISKEEASWIASLMWVSKPLGVILVTTCVDYIGRKSSILISGLFLAFGWTCFFIENSIASIYAFRILGGVGTGMVFTAFPLYIGEIADAKIRGALVGFIVQSLVMGGLLGTTIGAYLDTWVFAAISLVPNLLFMISFHFVPHSPHHLVQKNELDEAAKSIQWYNRNADAESELANLKKLLQNTEKVTFADSCRELIKPLNRRTLTMIIFISGFLQLSGVHVIGAYMEIIFTKTRVTVVAPATMVIIIGFLGIASGALTMYTNDKYGRTIMLTVSSIGVATGLFLFGLIYQLIDLGFNNPHLQWISLSAAVIFQFSLSIGLIPMPATLMSEIFAPNVKSLATCITSILASVFAFIATKSFQPMVDFMSEKYVFWINALFMLFAAVFTITIVPETKGKTLVEIQELLLHGHKSHSGKHSTPEP